MDFKRVLQNSGINLTFAHGESYGAVRHFWLLPVQISDTRDKVYLVNRQDSALAGADRWAEAERDTLFSQYLESTFATKWVFGNTPKPNNMANSAHPGQMRNHSSANETNINRARKICPNLLAKTDRNIQKTQWWWDKSLKDRGKCHWPLTRTSPTWLIAAPREKVRPEEGTRFRGWLTEGED